MFDNLFNKILLKTIKIEKGEPILLNKIPFAMFPARSMATLLQKVGQDMGEDFLFNLGYDAGIIVADEFIEKLGWLDMSMARRLFDIFRMFEVMGFGKIDLKVWDTKNKRMLLHLSNHPVLIHAVKIYGRKEKACNMYRGIFSAHANEELGIKGCKFIETQCIKNRIPFCEWSYNYLKK